MSRPDYRVPAGTRPASKPQPHVMLIEGEHVTFDDIAARLGVAYTTAKKRVAKARAADGPVTWAALGLKAVSR